ncbi:unnamed protein product [Discosporangium mesarthrocarpum]
MFRKFIFLCFLALAASEISETVKCNETRRLSVDNTAAARSLAEELMSCSDGIFEVMWTTTVNVESTIHVSNGNVLSVNGTGSSTTDVRGGGSAQLFIVEGGSELHLFDLALMSGNASYYGGGAVFLRGSYLMAVRCSFMENSAAGHGGAIFAVNSSMVLLKDTTFEGNTARFWGGAIYVNTSVLALQGESNFVGNTAGM